MATPQAPHLERSITLGGGIALVVGAVVGAGIYALVGEIGAQAGSAMWLAFIVAIVVSVLGVIPLLQLASAVPRAGAGYTFGSRMLSPYVGVLTSFIVLLAGGCSTCIVAYGLAQYLRGTYGLDIPPKLLGLLCMLLFWGIYVVGMRLALSLQMLMAVQFLAALVLYLIGGIWHSGVNFAFTPEADANSFFVGVLLCYSTCMGFQVVAELGEEMRDPKRNIPLALIIGGVLVAIIYVLVSSVFTASIPFDAATYDAMEAPLIDSARLFMPGWLLHFMTFGAITAGLTSFNAGAVALPREMFAMARDEVLPRWLAGINPRNHTPLRAVSVYFLCAAVLLLIPGLGYEFYGILTAVGIQAMSAILAISALRLPVRYPERYAGAYLRFPPVVIWFCAIATVFISMGFITVMALEGPLVLVTLAVFIVAVTVYYFLRVRWLERGGRPWRKQVSTLDDDALPEEALNQ